MRQTVKYSQLSELLKRQCLLPITAVLCDPNWLSNVKHIPTVYASNATKAARRFMDSTCRLHLLLPNVFGDFETDSLV